jgi:hypothetical protein
MIIFSHLILNFVLLHCYLCVINKILAKEFLYAIIMEQLRLFRAVLNYAEQNVLKADRKACFLTINLRQTCINLFPLVAE